MLKWVKNYSVLNINQIKPDFDIYKNDTQENQIRYELIQKKFFEKLEIIKGLQKKHS